ncbi:bactofilin family protein [Kushneria phosphatilytica]|uniref:Polymer-forming cytoskeletal protein n=1 Tax=Kushneria phosphatilytica TaxID=657387 RepID=A0A1S1NPZ3_9GAMM|nr:polymer-forming cytoskeletal protein [Kushneria phosphatilytica]OHV10459.1 hypothetical protein BH688_08510 [Kushneria phosphatilytica]QEL11994.1 polymer-forming cytoskeletal protein [Kushneria phosphatilytica]
MDTMGWLLIPGIVAILLILYDGQRRVRKVQLREKECAGAPSEVLTPSSSPAVINRVEDAPIPASRPSSDAAAWHQQRHGPVFDGPLHTGSFIGPSMHVAGHIEATQPLTVAGRIEGEITLHDHGVAILAGGEAGPIVRARQLVVDGRLNGAVQTTDSAIFHAAAHFEGELRAGRLRCVEGATLSGQFSIG